MMRISRWGPLLLLPALLVVSVQDHVLFWDTIQFAGKHPDWYYQHRFAYLILPEEIDSGHPPLFGMYIAWCWLIFGKSLAVTHWAMYPILVGIGWQAWRLARRVCRQISPIWLMALLLLDPVLLGQMVLVSPDLVLVFFFLLGLNAVLQEQRPWQLIAMLGLALVSSRGMMVVLALFCFEVWYRRATWQARPVAGLGKLLVAYLPAGLAASAFLIYHYLQTGWIGYHADSPWSYSFARANWQGIGRNLAILAWRWLDYGRFVLWAVLLWLGYRQYQKKSFSRITKYFRHLRSKPGGRYFVLFAILFLLLSISFLSFQGLNSHRYLLPVFLSFTVWVIALINGWPSARQRRISLSFILVAFLSGHLWVYPDRISQDWDASLAHWPYYQLRDEMLRYLEQQQIEPHQVGTAFPDIGPFRFREINEDQQGFHEKDLQRDSLILYSNIMNDFTDAELLVLGRDWEIERRWDRAGVKFILYRRPD